MLRLSLRRSGSSIVKVEELADPEELSRAAAMVDFPLIYIDHPQEDPNTQWRFLHVQELLDPQEARSSTGGL